MSSPAKTTKSPEHRSRLQLSGFRQPEVWVAFFGLVYYVAQGGLSSLNPLNIEWLRKTNDWTQQYLGWAFGRQSPWSLPFGDIPLLGRPVGTSLAFTGTHPLLCLMLRPFSSILPVPFQFHGPWMGACMALQGVFGVKLTRAVVPKDWADDRLMPSLGGCLFVVAPILLHRIDHDTLMSHFLILGALWLCLSPMHPSGPSLKAQRRYGVVLSIVTAGTHPYLLAMVGPFLLFALTSSFLKDTESLLISASRIIGITALWFIGIGGELWILGYFSAQDSASSWGFGHFNSDLSTLFNPIGWSRLLPTLPYTSGQFYEGFGFMGLGGLGLVSCALVLSLFHPALCRLNRRSAAVTILASGMAVFALSSQITWLGRRLIYLPQLYSLLGPVPNILRSSGRLFWPMHYVLLTFAIYILTHALPRPKATAGIGLALIATLLDLEPEKVSDRLLTAPYEALRAPIWKQIVPGTRHVVMLPPLFPASGGGECAPWRSPTKFEVAPSFFAAEHGMSINSVYASRPRESVSRPYCNRIVSEAIRGEFEADVLYLVDPRLAPQIIKPHEQLTCWQADGRIGCLHRNHPQQPLVADMLGSKTSESLSH